jgi:hypothetical protein
MWKTKKAAAAAVAAALAATGAGALAAPAQASSSGTCRFEAHVRFSQPITMSSSHGYLEQDGPGRADCTGTLDNSLTSGGGTFELAGSYGNPQSWFSFEDTCVLGLGRTRFTASVPRALQFFHPSPIDLEGQIWSRRFGNTLYLEGQGFAGGDRVVYTGTAELRPDPGQDCTGTPITSGTLVQNVTVTEGGSAQRGQPEALDETTPPSPPPARKAQRNVRVPKRHCHGRGRKRYCHRHASRRHPPRPVTRRRSGRR